MATIEVYNQKGEKIDDVELSESVFDIEPNVHVMHQVCRSQMAARRQGTHETKTRGNVSGGGRKPWRQKGTGHARQGSIRAPQWVGGGTVFGPHPHKYNIKINRKEVKLAMRSALSAKLADSELKVVDALDFEAPKTKEAVAVMKALDLEGRTTLVIGSEDVNAYLSFRNIPGVRIITSNMMNTYDFIDNKNLVFTLASIKHVEEVLA